MQARVSSRGYIRLLILQNILLKVRLWQLLPECRYIRVLKFVHRRGLSTLRCCPSGLRLGVTRSGAVVTLASVLIETREEKPPIVYALNELSVAVEGQFRS